MEGEDEGKEYMFKVLLVGEPAVGKTCMLKRWVHGMEITHTKTTIGTGFGFKLIKWDHNTLVRVQLWDIAGQERVGNMTRIYFADAVGAVVMYDVSRLDEETNINPTLLHASNWKMDIDKKTVEADRDPIPCILMANKIDLLGKRDNLDGEGLYAFKKEHRFRAWFATSVRDNIGIDEGMKALVAMMIECAEGGYQQLEEKDPDIIDLRSPSSAALTRGHAPSQREGCCK